MVETSGEAVAFVSVPNTLSVLSPVPLVPAYANLGQVVRGRVVDAPNTLPPFPFAAGGPAWESVAKERSPPKAVGEPVEIVL